MKKRKLVVVVISLDKWLNKDSEECHDSWIKQFLVAQTSI